MRQVLRPKVIVVLTCGIAMLSSIANANPAAYPVATPIATSDEQPTQHFSPLLQLAQNTPTDTDTDTNTNTSEDPISDTLEPETLPAAYLDTTPGSENTASRAPPNPELVYDDGHVLTEGDRHKVFVTIQDKSIQLRWRPISTDAGQNINFLFRLRLSGTEQGIVLSTTNAISTLPSENIVRTGDEEITAHITRLSNGDVLQRGRNYELLVRFHSTRNPAPENAPLVLSNTVVQPFTTKRDQLPVPDGITVQAHTTGVTMRWDPAATGLATHYRFSLEAGGTSTEVSVRRGVYQLDGLARNRNYSLRVIARARFYADSGEFAEGFSTVSNLPVFSLGAISAASVEVLGGFSSVVSRWRFLLTDRRGMHDPIVVFVFSLEGMRTVDGLYPGTEYLLTIHEMDRGSTATTGIPALLRFTTPLLHLPAPTEDAIRVTSGSNTIVVEALQIPESVQSFVAAGQPFKYLLSLRSSDDGTEIERTSLSASQTHTFGNLITDTTYMLAVTSSIDVTGFVASSPLDIPIRLMQLPQLPMPSGIRVEAGMTTALVSWDEVTSGATHYLLQLEEVPEVTTVVSVAVRAVELSDLEPLTRYVLRVSARAERYRDSEPYKTNFVTQRDSIDRVRFHIRAFLQGATESNAAGAYMRADLVLRGHLPASSALVRPWPGLPSGIEAVEVLPANRDAMNTGVMSRVLAGAPEGGRIGIVDWVMVEVRVVNRGDAVPLRLTDTKRVRRSYALLRSDGRIVNADAENLLATDAVFEVSGLDFSRSTEDLYVVINHRNHVDVISLIAAAATGANTYRYDFTRESFENVMTLTAGVWALSTGDHDSNGDVDHADRNAQAGEFGAAGYLLGDINLDGDVNLNDRSMLINSYGKSQLLRN